MKKRETYWLLGTLGLGGVFTILLLGMDGFKPDSTLDVNIYDTYFVFANFNFIALIFVFTFFGVYLFRTIKQGFKNLTANLILMIVIILMVLIFGIFISMLNTLSLPYSTITNTTLSREITPVESLMVILSKALLGFQIVLLVFLGYCGFRTGRNYTLEK